MFPAGNVSLRTVSSSRPQLFRTESQQSAVASDDYYSLSSRTSATRSASGGSRATVVRYATPNSHPISRNSSPGVSRTLLAPPSAVPRAEQNLDVPAEQRDTFVTNIDSTTQSDEKRDTHLGATLDGGGGGTVRDSYAGREPTPGVDDSPYIRFAISQLTREGENGNHRRSSESGSESTPTGNLLWDGNLGHFVRSTIPPTPQQQQLPPERSPQDSVDPEAFVPVHSPPEGNLIYPPLDFVPIALRPWALGVVIVCVLLMIAGIAFSNVWSQDKQGLWGYNGRSGARYFVVQFLPQILGIIITIATFVVQAAVYRVMPFAMMGSERPFDKVLQGLPIVPKNFLLPDLSHFIHGEALVGFSLFTIWLSNISAVPLLGCFYQVKWAVIDGEGDWRWAAVRAVGWTLVAVYGLLTIGLTALMLRFLRTWSGLMWDPVCLADLITLVQRSNVLPDFDYSETALNVGKTLKSRVLRLGYWQLSKGRHPEIFYGIGEVGGTVGNPSLHLATKNRREHLSKVSFDAEKHGAASEDDSQDIYSPTVRYRWTPWFLRRHFMLAWTVILVALFIAFVVVSFVNNAVEDGFLPRLSTRPSSSAFSSSNFLFSLIPALIGNFLFLAWQHIDVYFRSVQPYVALSSPEGTSAEQSLLLAYPSLLPFEVTVTALINRHYKVAWISFMSVVSSALPILAGGVFFALTYPENEIRVTPLMPAFYAIVVFCAVYMASFFTIWPGRYRYLPHDISTLAEQISFLYQSPLLSDKLLREPRSKTDLVTRLVVAPPGDQVYPRYGFGIYIPGRLLLPMEDIVTGMFFSSYVYTPKDPLVRMGSMELLPQLYAAAPLSSPVRMSALAVSYFSVAAWTNQEHLLQFARQCFVDALTLTRKTLQGDVEQSFDELLMTMLLLYIYEEFDAIKEHRQPSKAHLRGAIALINKHQPKDRDSFLSSTLRNAVQTEIINVSVDDSAPLVPTTDVWPLALPIQQLASSRLTTASTAAVNLRQRWVQYTTAGVTNLNEVEGILSEACLVDSLLLAWTESLPPHWDPIPATFIPQSVRDAGIYQDRCDCYMDFWIAETWNKYRASRLAVQKIIMYCLHLLPDREADMESTTEMIRAIATDTCATVPFFLGTQTNSVLINANRIEYPAAGTGLNAAHRQSAPMLGGWFILSSLENLLSIEFLTEDQLGWVRRQVQRCERSNKTTSTSAMVFSFFSSTPKPADAENSPPPAPPQAVEIEIPATPLPSSAATTKPQDDELPKLWTPRTNTKLALGGALFFAFSVFTTRRAFLRRVKATTPPYWTSSPYHKPKANGGMDAFEALNLATINVLSFAMMASGSILWALDINGVEDMRRYVRTRAASGILGGEGNELSDADKEMEKEMEEFVGRYLGKRVEDGKLVDLHQEGKDQSSS
ncbi:hypothetical protein BJY01DRAFT_233094 [Aspergillus pseudoustus]|uniref:Uncharacterized protein n=1 Tax=Aspergillus pseudoustus TaxID=1810923 RepID=A0ABR4KEJ5_9EURO